MIIAITGKNGAGKGTVVDYLIRERGFYHASAREFLLREMKKKNLPLDRPSITSFTDTLRKNREPKNGYLMNELLKEAQAGGENAVIESVRAIAEIEFLREKLPGILIWAVDADPKIRHERVVHRKSHTDKVTFEEFIAQEKTECDNTEPWKGNLSRCMELADLVFENDGSKEELEAKVEAALRNLLPNSLENGTNIATR